MTTRDMSHQPNRPPMLASSESSESSIMARLKSRHESYYALLLIPIILFLVSLYIPPTMVADSGVGFLALGSMQRRQGKCDTVGHAEYNKNTGHKILSRTPPSQKCYNIVGNVRGIRCFDAIEGSGYGSSPSRCRPGRVLAAGQTWDLPVPAQRASTHARFFDHAGPSGHSRSRARPYCLPPSQQRRHPGYESLRGSMAGLCAPLPTLRRRPHGRPRTARG